MSNLSSSPADLSQAPCCYVNNTDKAQIIRISHISGCFYERTVFAGQRILFDAPLQAVLEIHTGSVVGAILSDRIPCNRLWISNPLSLK